MTPSDTVTKNLSSGLSHRCNLEQEGHLLRLSGVSLTQIRFSAIGRFASTQERRHERLYEYTIRYNALVIQLTSWSESPRSSELLLEFLSQMNCFLYSLLCIVPNLDIHFIIDVIPILSVFPLFFRLETRHVSWPLHVASCNRWYQSPV